MTACTASTLRGLMGVDLEAVLTQLCAECESAFAEPCAAGSPLTPGPEARRLMRDVARQRRRRRLAMTRGADRLALAISGESPWDDLFGPVREPRCEHELFWALQGAS